MNKNVRWKIGFIFSFIYLIIGIVLIVLSSINNPNNLSFLDILLGIILPLFLIYLYTKK